MSQRAPKTEHARRRSTVTADSFIEHKPFLSDKFDVHDYANAVLHGRTYQPDGEVGLLSSAGGLAPPVPASPARPKESGDLGVEVARLNYGIEDVTRQLRQEITQAYPQLLAHLTTSLALSSQLAPIRASLGSLNSSIDRLHTKIHAPHAQLSLLVRRLALLAQASDLTRRAARFVLVSRRLAAQMERVRTGPAGDGASVGDGEKERELAKAALSVAELDVLLALPGEDEDDEPGAGVDAIDTSSRPFPLQTLDFVRAYTPMIDEARDAIITEMENMVVQGLASLNQPLLSTSLQTAHNLRLLPDLVSNLVADLNDAVAQRVHKAFDSTAIGREVAGKDSSHAIKFTTRARTQTEPSSANLSQWNTVLWKRLDRVIEDVANCCIKVYTLEKVLKIKRDSVTQVDFLDEVMKTLDEKPSFTFWTTLAKAFETQTKDAMKANGWLQQTLSTGYPRLLRLFHDFFAKISVHTDTVYSREHQSPEAVLVLRSVSTFETLYLSRSTTRMNDAVTIALNTYAPQRGLAPGASEGVNIARVIVNELDTARFDPLLVQTVARNAAKVLTGLKTRIDGMLVRDFTATSLTGQQATPAEMINGQLVSCLYHLTLSLGNLEGQFGSKVSGILVPTIVALEETYRKTTDALDIAIKREFGNILARIHRVDFSKPVDPMAMGSGASPYMQDLVDKIGFLRTEVLSRMSMGEYMRQWVLALSRFLIRTFLLHASIARPMGESGRLKLTGNMTEFEMSLQNFLMTGRVQGSGSKTGLKVSQIGDEYYALRAFRQLLFADAAGLVNPAETAPLPPLVVAHHAVVRSPLRLPHEVRGWSEHEYVLWLDKHTDDEAWDLLESTAAAQVEGEDAADEDRAALGMVRTVLTHARHHHEKDAQPHQH